MDSFDEDVLLAKEWLIKVDPHTSTPYLIKFHSSPVDLTCCIMITDTKRTWAESLSSKQFARRWRECNNQVDLPPPDVEDEEAWRTRSLDLLSGAHTLGGMLDLSFEVGESRFGDIAFQLECNAFKWRWETIFVGHKVSAGILSKHLIMPLISVNHLAFSSPDVVGDLAPTDLEKAVDKIARTARRTVDTHVKNALSKPRLATTIRRITAVLNFISDPPSISNEIDSPVLHPPREPVLKIRTSPERLKTTRAVSPELDVGSSCHGRDRATDSQRNIIKDRQGPLTRSNRDSVSLSRRPSPINRAADSGSATEPEDDNALALPARPTPAHAFGAASAAATAGEQWSDVRMRSPTPPREDGPPHLGGGTRGRSVSKAPASDTDSSPVRPIKKSKPRAPSEDEDSEGERKRLAAEIRRGTAHASGLRQPIKRGGKRF